MNKLFEYWIKEIGHALARAVTGKTKRHRRHKKEKLTFDRVAWHLFGNVGLRDLYRTRRL